MVSNKNSSFNEQKTRLFNKLRKEIKDERVLTTMMGVPRENFINSNMREKT